MESYVLVDSVQRSSGVSNAYTYNLKKVLKGVYKSDLLSSCFSKTDFMYSCCSRYCRI